MSEPTLFSPVPSFCPSAPAPLGALPQLQDAVTPGSQEDHPPPSACLLPVLRAAQFPSRKIVFSSNPVPEEHSSCG